MPSKDYAVMNWVNGFIGLFVRAENFKNNDEIWFARSAFIYTYIGAAVAGVYCIFYGVLDSYGASLSLGILSLLLILTTPLHLYGKSRLLAKINLSATSFGLAGVVVHMGGVDSSAACWLLGVTPGVTALLFRRAREIFQLTGLTLCLYCVIFAAELSGFQVYHFTYPEGSLFERVYTFIHFAVFCIFIATALAIFATTQRKLLRQVENQARDVKAILSHIQQGIFTIDSEDLRVDDEYSDYLEKITEMQALGNRKVSELIFNKTTLSREQIDMTESVLVNCINEPSFNFSMNEEHLIRHALYLAPSGELKSILLDWQPIVNVKRDIIEKILVTLTDVTELSKAKNDSMNKQREIEIISEIVEVNHEKFEQFVRSSIKFINENASITESASGLDDIKILFINMHTLKGAARTYRLNHLTAVIHECEHYYAQIQREELTWNREEAKAHLETVRSIFAKYVSISRDKLKRGHFTNQVQLDLESVRENIRLLQKIEGVAFDDRLTPFFQNVKKTFYGLYYMDVQVLFDEILKNLPLLAKDLGKVSPHVQFKASDVGLSADACEVIRNAFVHILRNSMDHGLETSEVRLERGKPEQGLINVETKVLEDGSLNVIYWDDGAGLALEKIRAIGLQKNLIQPSEIRTQTLAELIFNPGFSTARSVTDISGRGVGMGAVKEFFEQLGGSVELRLKAGANAQGSTPFEIIMTVPSAFVSVRGMERGPLDSAS